MRVLVTRPAEQAEHWVRDLRDAGIDAVGLPLLRIAAPADGAAVARAWAGLASYALVFFVSPNAAQRFFALAPLPPQWPAGVMAAAPGPGTAAALRALGVPPAQVEAPPPDSPTFDAAALWAHISHRPWRGRRVLVVHGEAGRDGLGSRFLAAGADVDRVVAYRRLAPLATPALCDQLQDVRRAPQTSLWLFSSSAAIGHLQGLAPGLLDARAQALATHPRIADAARHAGAGRVVACAPTLPAVTAAIAAWPSIQSAPT